MGTVDDMSWYLSLPPAETQVPCGTATHAVRWEAGRLTLPAHPDAEAEMVLGALGGDKPGCVTLAETWARHTGDLAVLAAGPRSAADRVTISWKDAAEEQRTASIHLALGGAFVQPPAHPSAHPSAHPPARPPAHPPAQGPVPVRRSITARMHSLQRVPQLITGGRAFASAPWAEELIRRETRRAELLQLLALGPAFQFRLAAAVADAWADPGQADERARHRPELTAALTGRFAPAAREWHGIDPDAVTVTPHEGPGWGTLDVTGAGQARRLRASLPVGWLSGVWACGLAVVDGHLVVAVEEPGYPRARVLAVGAPDAAPVRLDVRASAGSADGLPRWSRGKV
jgi:hypothetical protein